ncbi:unnamed protein product [Parajaminaea phylloscopi]
MAHHPDSGSTSRPPPTDSSTEGRAAQATPTPSPGPSSMLGTAPVASSLSASSSTASASQPSKIDAVLYNLFSKSVALVTAGRLTHWQDADVPISGAPAASPAATPDVRVNKWFGIPLPDYGFFREELRLWRSVTAYAPHAALEASLETPADEAIGAPGVSVPTLVLDVILDPAHLLGQDAYFLTRAEAPASDSESDRSRTTAATPLSCTPIVLERWRMDLNVFSPTEPPDLQVLYKRCTTHLQSFASLVDTLPTRRLCEQISHARRSHQETDADEACLMRFLQVGCRLGAGEPEDADQATEYGIRDSLSDAEDALQHTRPSDAGGEAITSGLHGFPPLICPIGSLNVSVEYRTNVDFAVHSRRRSQTAAETAMAPRSSDPPTLGVTTHVDGALISSSDLRPDEDYFKPDPPRAPPSACATPAPEPTTNNARSATPSDLPPPRRVSGLPSVQEVVRPSSAVASPPGPSEKPAVERESRRSVPDSLFTNAKPRGAMSSGTTSKPVAGLSGFRHQGAFVTTATAAAESSALSSSPGAGEPAFLTAHSRRVSSSSSTGSATERRFRSLSTFGGSGSIPGDRSSPPSPVTSAQPPSPTAAGIPLRPNLPSHHRFGSYSPSSPSPLAQQLASASGTASASARPEKPTDGPTGHVQAVQGRALSLGGAHLVASQRSSAVASDKGAQQPLTVRNIFQRYAPEHLGQSRASIAASVTSPLPTTRPPDASPRPRLQRLGSTGSSSNDLSSSHPGNPLDSSEANPASSSALRGPQPGPTVSPQMIQRYPRTPSYRRDPHMRNPGSLGSTSQEHESGSGALGSSAGGQDSSHFAGASGASEGSYSRSWQARTEARQQAVMMMAAHRGSLGSSPSMSAMGGPTASFLHRTSFGIGGPGSGSPVSLYSRASPGSLLGRDSPSNTRTSRTSLAASRRGSVDELVAMIESRPALQSSSALASSAPRVKGEQGGTTASQSQGAPSVADRRSGDAISVSASSVSPASPKVLLSKGAMDDLLARMNQSVSRLTLYGRKEDPPRLESFGSAAPSLSRVGAGEGGESSPAGPRRTNLLTGSPGSSDQESTLRQSGADHGFSSSSVEGGQGALAFGPSTRSALPSFARSRDSAGQDAGPAGLMQRRPDRDPRCRSSDMFNEEDEEPAGHLELHSDPVTPTVERVPLRHHHAEGLSVTPPGGQDFDSLLGGGISREADFALRATSRGEHINRTRSSSAHRRNVTPYGQSVGAQPSMMPAPNNGRVQDEEEIGDAERLRSFGEELSSVRGRRGASSLSHHPMHPHHIYHLNHPNRQHGYPSAVSGLHGNGASQAAGNPASPANNSWRSRRTAMASGSVSPSSVAGSPVGSPGPQTGPISAPAAAAARGPSFRMVGLMAGGLSTGANAEDRSISRRASPHALHDTAMDVPVGGGTRGAQDGVSDTTIPRLLQTQRQNAAQERWWDYQSQRERDI